MRWLLALAVAALIVFAWMFRYELVVARGVFALDRWTGHVYIFAGTYWLDAGRPKEPPWINAPVVQERGPGAFDDLIPQSPPPKP